jgi:hypothetical protein
MNGTPQEPALPPPKGGALKAGVDWVAKHWPRVRLGHEGMMLEKIGRQNRIVEVAARNTMTGKMDDTEGWPSDEEDEDMGVNIGDEIHHHHYPAPPAEAATEPPPLGGESSTPAKTLLEKAAPYLLAATLAGVPGGSIATYFLTRPDPAPPPAASSPAPVGYEYTGQKFTPGQD